MIREFIIMAIILFFVGIALIYWAVNMLFG